MTDLMIIGKSGQLGTELVNICNKRGKRFVAFGSEELDITNYAKVNKVIGVIKPKIIINTAAFHVVPECEKNPNRAFAVNSLAVGNLAEVAKKHKLKLVTYSTDYVFDGKKGKPYLETDLPNPLQAYGLSKLAGETNAQTIYPEGVYIIRTCGLYGGKASSKSKKGNFVLNILTEAKRGSAVKVSSELIVNPTFAGDLAKTTLKLLGLNAPSGVYHLANEGFMSWYDFARKILKFANLKNQVIPLKGQATARELKRPRFSALANTQASKLGIVMPTIEDGLKKYLKEIL
jgi:dTDP-4-dehydrorhamnose reductase